MLLMDDCPHKRRLKEDGEPEGKRQKAAKIKTPQ
jgi:hypothetical protein